MDQPVIVRRQLPDSMPYTLCAEIHRNKSPNQTLDNQAALNKSTSENLIITSI